MTEATPLRPIYIMGRPHSGSTVLSALLGSLPGVRAVGELHQLAEARLGRCSCGALRPECPFWARVRAAFARRATSRDWATFLAIFRDGTASPRMLRLPLAGPDQPEAARLLQGLDALYESLAEVSGADTILDASRNPFVAELLLRGRPEARVIHLVRDGADALYSKLRRMEEGRGFRWYRFHWSNPAYSAPLLQLSGASWAAGNLLAELVALRHGSRVLRVRYEDLCADPAGTLATIGAFLGKDTSALAQDIASHNPIPIDHLIGGNGFRLDGPFVFRPDSGKPLPRRHRAVFRLYAWPLLARYGYAATRGSGP